MDSHLKFTRFNGKRLHLGVCGSIACYKSLDLVRRWRDAGLDVGATLTASARKFLTPLSFEALGASPVFTSMFPEGEEAIERDIFPHLTPGASAHVLAIVAASATTLARLAHGMSDEILSCQALAFSGPLVLAPAMNPRMWANAATQENWETLRRRGHTLVEPVCGRVACMDEGGGRLADTRDIYLAVLRAVSPQDMQGQKVLVTLGPTREHWDDIRYWSNPSTGAMGACIALAAHLRGADVHAVAGPTVPWLPLGITRHDVVSAKDMFAASSDLWPDMDAGIFTAAVADFAPEKWGSGKFKKATAAAEGLRIDFSANPDILKTLAAAKKPGQKVVGFAAESENLEASALRKLTDKNADMIVGNTLAGFAATDNTVFVADRTGKQEHWPSMGKPDLAWRILDWLSRL